jgi:hypothetical protein
MNLKTDKAIRLNVPGAFRLRADIIDECPLMQADMRQTAKSAKTPERTSHDDGTGLTARSKREELVDHKTFAHRAWNSLRV